MLGKKKWTYNSDSLSINYRDFGIDEVTARILRNRGIVDKNDIEEFFMSDDINNMHNPRLMKDAEKAAKIIEDSISNNEEIVIHTDYDNDGASSGIVGVDLLNKAGAKVTCFANNRFDEGYGINEKSAKRLISENPEVKLVITADNGILAFEGVDYLKNQGIKVIVTDHHEPGQELPNVDAVVNPKRNDCEYPFKGLCGAVVIYKVLEILYDNMGLDREILYEQLDILAMATVGDVVPLVNENRIIVKKGVDLLNNPTRKATKVLKELTNTDEVTAHWTLGFVYVPILNASGRITGDVLNVVDLFFQEEEEEIVAGVKELIAINDERKQITSEQMELAEKQLEKKGVREVIVVSDESFHEGIVGLVAGRLKEKYNRPVFVFSQNGETMKGSARSIDGFHLFESIEELVSKGVVLGGGGHAKAAGLSILSNKVDEFEEAVVSMAKEKLTEDDFVKKIEVDARVFPKELSIEFIESLKELEPFGEMFPKPILMLDDFRVQSIFFMGKEKNHLKLTGSNGVSVIAWGGRDMYESKGTPSTLRMLGYPELNVYNGKTTVQFMIQDDNFKGK